MKDACRACLTNPEIIFTDVKWGVVFIVHYVYSVQKKKKKGTLYINRAG